MNMSLVYGYKPDNEDEQVVDHTDPVTGSSPESPPEPVRPRIRVRTRRPRFPRPMPEQIRIQDQPVDAVAQSNIQVLRVGPRLRDILDVLDPAVDQVHASENRAAPNDSRRAMEVAASGNVFTWLAAREQAEREVPGPTAAPGRVGRRLRDTRRLFISDGRGSGRSYDRTVNGARGYLDGVEADLFQERPRREPPPSTGPLSEAELIERLATVDQSQIDAVQGMVAEMTPWSLNGDRDGPTPEDIYREAYRRLDNSTATGEERRILQMHVQRGIDGMLREQRQSSLDMWPRGV